MSSPHSNAWMECRCNGLHAALWSLRHSVHFCLHGLKFRLHWPLSLVTFLPQTIKTPKLTAIPPAPYHIQYSTIEIKERRENSLVFIEDMSIIIFLLNFLWSSSYMIALLIFIIHIKRDTVKICVFYMLFKQILFFLARLKKMKKPNKWEDVERN